MNIVIELPDDDETSGGIARMIRLAFELPHFAPVAGGINDTIKLAEQIDPNVHIRFQKRTRFQPITKNSWSIGLPDASFPAADVVITYSDTPYMKELVALPQVKKVMILMLSWGMCFDRERPNVHTPGITVMCSTTKIQRSIESEGIKVHRVGFGLEMDKFQHKRLKRNNYTCLMYNNMRSKRYETGVKVVDRLTEECIIDGAITFGRIDEYNLFKHPKKLVKHYVNANKDELCDIFNTCKLYIMPSISEGLNLTPMEATLCGCPTLMVDGTDELYADGFNCIFAPADDVECMVEKSKEMIENFEHMSIQFWERMERFVDQHKWSDVISNIIKLL